MKNLRQSTTSNVSSIDVDGIRPKGSALLALQSSVARLQKSARPNDGGAVGRVATSVFKIATTAAMSVALVFGLTSLGGTASFFFDVEKSTNNIFIADPLYFTVSASSTQIDMSGAPQTITPLMIPGEDSEPIQYFVTATTTSGDPSLCSAIHLVSTAPFVYDGPLLALSSGTSTQTGPWTLSFSLAPGANVAANTSCTMDLVYKGWNANALPGLGYSDTERLSLEFFIPADAAPSKSSTGSPQASSEQASSPQAAPPTPPVVPATAPAPSDSGDVLGDSTSTIPVTDDASSSTPPTLDDYSTPPPADPPAATPPAPDSGTDTPAPDTSSPPPTPPAPSTDSNASDTPATP